jgi:hypothetical protein
MPPENASHRQRPMKSAYFGVTDDERKREKQFHRAAFLYILTSHNPKKVTRP